MGARDPASNYVAVLSTVLPAPTIFGHFSSYSDKEDLPKKMVAFEELQFIPLSLQPIIDPQWLERRNERFGAVN
jgi:hypothetical protein